MPIIHLELCRCELCIVNNPTLYSLVRYPNKFSSRLIYFIPSLKRKLQVDIPFSVCHSIKSGELSIQTNPRLQIDAYDYLLADNIFILVMHRNRYLQMKILLI